MLSLDKAKACMLDKEGLAASESNRFTTDTLGNQFTRILGNVLIISHLSQCVYAKILLTLFDFMFQYVKVMDGWMDGRAIRG